MKRYQDDVLRLRVIGLIGRYMHMRADHSSDRTSLLYFGDEMSFTVKPTHATINIKGKLGVFVKFGDNVDTNNLELLETILKREGL